MIPTEKLRALARRLDEKTAHNEVRWQYDEVVDRACAVVFRNSLIRLLYESPSTEPDRVRMKFEKLDNDYGPTPVDEWVVEEGDSDWPLASGLYDKASRTVYGWDKLLAEVEEEVNSDGPIGLATSHS